MFLLRNVSINDLNEIHRLSQLMNFINLPPYIEMLEKKIKHSIKSFTNPSKILEHNYFIFVLENFLNKQVVGVSIIHSQHGTPDEPHFYLKVSSEKKYSQTLNTGFVHGTLKLGIDTNGPTEIGGLVLAPKYRNHPEKLGKQLSFIRFLYILLNRPYFKDTIHAELLPPFDADGNSPLWEAIGRRFLNMDYHEADLLSRTNKEFILSLFPRGTIYQTLLPIEASDSIGKVGPETIPVQKMLTKIGFKYNNEIDPFDGGPHFRAKIENLTIYNELIKATVCLYDQSKIIDLSRIYLLTLPPNNEYHFRAIAVSVNLTREKKSHLIYLDRKIYEAYNLTEEFYTHLIPL